jgi:putative transposase
MSLAFPRTCFADNGFAGNRLTAAIAGHGRWQIEIVKCSDRAIGFHVLPRRWVAERTPVCAGAGPLVGSAATAGWTSSNACVFG